jgi:putative molybdopterin biosynthesis protein
VGEVRLSNALKRHRDLLGLSQQALADRVGVSRQAIHAIEAGRQVPSTSLGLQLAYALGCTVENLFQVVPLDGLAVRLASASPAPPRPGVRVAVGAVDGRWVAHPLPLDASLAADGVVSALGAGDEALVRPVGHAAELTRNVLVAGCAPLLGALSSRVGARFVDARLTWLAESSRRALDLLSAGLVHVAGLHLFDPCTGQDNVSVVREAFPGRRMLVINLTRWRQGFVVAGGNPLGIRTAADLLRPGIRMARREEGAGAHKLVGRLLAAEGAEDRQPEGPFASGHADVARLVRCGAADVGVAIEGVAVPAGLDFVPLAEERFDLVLPAAQADTAPVCRLLEALDDPGFRADIAHLPGYDGGLCGHVTTVEAC